MNRSSERTTSELLTQRGIGLPAAAPEDGIFAGAQSAEANGYHSFWLNNPPRGNALVTLGQVARDITMWVGVGVIPFSDHPANEIVERVRENHLPLDRFYLGVGSGSGPGGLQRVRDGVRAIRAQLDCMIVVAALGPKMCRLGGAEADAVLFNWLTPAFARTSIQWVREGAEEAGRPAPRLVAYTRVALGDEARARLEREASNYEAIPQYAAHFKRMGVPAMGTTLTGDAQDIQRGLSGWDGVVDEVVLRVVTAHDTADEIRQVVEAAKPAGR
jgi:alkanesulfonate monooxygenase SsuD/methylene tetrahydromethanopterin reductase-like flavin-dependent oxidoreductase (luciferase family)